MEVGGFFYFKFEYSCTCTKKQVEKEKWKQKKEEGDGLSNGSYESHALEHETRGTGLTIDVVYYLFFSFFFPLYKGKNVRSREIRGGIVVVSPSQCVVINFSRLVNRPLLAGQWPVG